MPFSETCETSGVFFDLSESPRGICNISNTAARVEEIKLEIQQILCIGFITQAEFQKVRGRMQFAHSQIYGGTGKRCARALGTLQVVGCGRKLQETPCSLDFL